MAIATGAFILVTSFISLETGSAVAVLRSKVLNTAVLLAAVALVLGVLNLAAVHSRKVREDRKNSLYSLILLFSLLITFSITLWQGPTGVLPQAIFNYIQVPIEISLMAVLTVSLTIATIRFLQRRPDLFTLVFVAVVLVSLVGSGPVFGIEVPFISDLLRPYTVRVLANAGARGVLLGVGLGTVATGLRVLLGADRPFGG